MDVKVLASAFGMKIYEFAKVVGYSRQGLYDLIDTSKKHNKTRYDAFVSHLELLNDAMYESDIKIALDKQKARNDIISQLKGRKGELDG